MPAKWLATMPGSSKVIDSWAMIAWLLDQAAASQVQTCLQQAEAGELRLLMSWINAGEVYYIAARRHGKARADAFLGRLASLPIRLVLPEESDIIAAARLKSAHRLAYADAFAAALAMREGAAVITGDPEIRALKDLVTVDWIGP
jgi:predicted nucleic acid-binding protein